jgi:S-formylglutathione hydrolase FrmB
VSGDPTRWAVGGLSAGATCAVQLAVNRPAIFPTVLAFSTQAEPTIGNHRDTVNRLFNGDETAFQAMNPLTVLKSKTFAGSAGLFVAGRSDSEYGPQTRAVCAAAKSAGMDAQYLEVPGGHDFPVWAAALSISMPWLGARLGITR